MAKKERLDVLLVERGWFESRQQAQRAIMAGLVKLGSERIDKAGTKVPVDAALHVERKPHPYVSRGGLKLEEAIRVFDIQLDQKAVLDIGASTGGFTDCALQYGARLVYAVDVGYGQLAWKLRQDPRVIVMERTNFRYLTPADWSGEQPQLAVIDVSFISVSKILPPLKALLHPEGWVMSLVKPQFEAGRERVGKKGIVKDPTVHRDVLHQFVKMANQSSFDVVGLAPSPITGGEGNIEFLSWMRADSAPNLSWEGRLEAVVEEAHRRHTNR
ncbi:TlyA family RNA methyltransferase [Desmospora activa]|uniref:23S rRNA (Cytidine1920-2'-O)/16S rRNA (Cytidine1409-2'-O)-methyltransferase n=1 Tax=Desmospora activa DSM 45169 TaxID=1121389 RepID=A0A2T4Z9J0_9BACL|nr:TlyA family RNA methyltransferase [Desmospora activa]PTM58537.1 23S rRNA (cytidine1920-2'-O)/16S rRNA (cytidine1409-2'-O)-methyltransferase [Desmospora activa DSM 45169]